MDKSNDVILCWEQNGQRLQADHGFPLRIIIPGFIGGRMVKWLKEIKVSDACSDNHYHFKDNRVLPVNVTPEQAPRPRGVLLPGSPGPVARAGPPGPVPASAVFRDVVKLKVDGSKAQRSRTRLHGLPL